MVDVNADDAHACKVLSGDHGCRGVLISVERYRELVASQVDDEAGAIDVTALVADRDALRRQLAERDELQRARPLRGNEHRQVGQRGPAMSAEKRDPRLLTAEQLAEMSACERRQWDPMSGGENRWIWDMVRDLLTHIDALAEQSAELRARAERAEAEAERRRLNLDLWRSHYERRLESSELPP
jgi:hypothetical protein